MIKDFILTVIVILVVVIPIIIVIKKNKTYYTTDDDMFYCNVCDKIFSYDKNNIPEHCPNCNTKLNW